MYCTLTSTCTGSYDGCQVQNKQLIIANFKFTSKEIYQTLPGICHLSTMAVAYNTRLSRIIIFVYNRHCHRQLSEKKEVANVSPIIRPLSLFPVTRPHHIFVPARKFIISLEHWVCMTMHAHSADCVVSVAFFYNTHFNE